MNIYLDWVTEPRVDGDGRPSTLVKVMASTNDTLAKNPEPYWYIKRIISDAIWETSTMGDFAFWFAYRMQQDVISNIQHDRTVNILPYPKETTRYTHGRDASVPLANDETDRGVVSSLRSEVATLPSS